MANKNKSKTTLRDSSSPYRLSLDEKTHLPPLSEITSSDDEDVNKSRYLHYRPSDFKRGTLFVDVHLLQETQQIKISINPDFLMVSCDCNSKVQKLCRHLFRVFSDLLKEEKYNFFKRYTEFPYSDYDFFDKYLKLDHKYWRHTEAIPKTEFGKIYKFEDSIKSENILPLSVSIPPPYREESAEANSIIFVMSGIRYVAEIPFLIPCISKFNVRTGKVLNFIEFKHPGDLSTGKNLVQKALNAFSEDFNQLLGFNKKPSEHRETENISQTRLIAFNYWKCLVPILAETGDVFYYSGFERKVDLKGKPKKSYMEKIDFSIERTKISFTLEQHDGYFKLLCHAQILDRNVKINSVYPYSSPFFFTLHDNTNLYYQFRSLEEGNIISEFHRANYCFTIQSQDLEEFNKDILAPIAVDYPVAYKFLSFPKEIQLNIVEKRIVLEDHGHYVSFNLLALYDNGALFSVLTNGSANLIYKFETIQIQHRDKLNEELFKESFVKLHPSFKIQINDNALFLSKESLLDEQWLAKCQYLMSDVTFVGIESIIDLNLHLGEPIIKTDVHQGADWFDVSVSVKFGEELMTPEDIHNALKKRSPVTKLKNGKIAYLPDSFFNRLSKPFRHGTLTEKGVKIPRQQYTLIDKLYDKLAKPNLAKFLLETTQLFLNIDDAPLIEVPNNVNAILRGYQKIGFTWMANLSIHKWGGLLADDMGLGKTLQVLTLLQYLKNNAQTVFPHLLLAPTSLLFNWKEEAEKFCPELNVLFFHGFSREKNPEELNKYDLIITSYGTSSVDIEFLMTMHFHYLILDEAQAIKNPYSQRYKTTMLIPAENRIALTGTPIENSTTDLYAIMNFINPGFFGTLKMFKENLLPIDNNDNQERNDTIAELIRPFILRRTKKQVAKDLPPKTEMILWCEMESEQRRIYDDYRKLFKKNLVERIDSEGLERSKFYVLEGLMKLRQICNSPLLMKNAPQFHTTSCKIKALMDHISENSLEHKLLVFSQFTSMLSLVRHQLEQQSISYCYLDGKTTPLNRKKEVDTFQNDQSIKIFLISLKAGGAGLNLTAADYVYLLDPWWNPAKEDQAIDRCYRIGQDKHVMAYKVICKDTLEERILDMQQRKKRLAEEIIPTDESILRTMGKEEILGLLD